MFHSGNEMQYLLLSCHLAIQPVLTMRHEAPGKTLIWWGTLELARLPGKPSQCTLFGGFSLA